MKLSRYLRKHSRTLILVFMSLLLVAFLVPQSIQNLGGGDRGQQIKLGKAFGRTITTSDIHRASADLQLLARLARAPGLPDEAAYLLMEEARRTGVRVSREDVKAGLSGAPGVDERLRQIQRSTHLSYDQIYDRIARWLAVERLATLQSVAVMDSLPRHEVHYRDRNEEAVARISVIEDKAFLHLVPEPTEEELRAFFEEGKARFTSHTEEALGFGYLQPDRVQVEYLTVDPEKVRAQTTIQAVRVKRFYEDYRHWYTKPDPLATQPVGGRFPQVPMTFEEARQQVREDYRKAKAIEEAQRLINDIYTEAHRPWSAAPRGEDGFSEPPQAGVVSFEELKQEFSTTYPVEHGKTELLSADELRDLPDIGSAGLMIGTDELVSVPDLALRVKGILERDPNDGKPACNVMEPVPVVLTRNYDPRVRQAVPYRAYLFRVVQVAPSAPPGSLDVVRDQLIEDWKLARAHDLARRQAEALAARARQVGLDAAVEQATELKEVLAAAEHAATQPASGTPVSVPPPYVNNLEPFTPRKILRRTVHLERPVGRVHKVQELIFELADVAVDETGPHRVASMPMASQYKWVVAELLEVRPIYEGAFEAYLAERTQDSQRRRREMGSFLQAWFSPENVKDRAGFTPDPTLAPVAP